MTPIQIAQLVFAIVGEAVSLGQLIISAATSDAAGAEAALVAADLALKTAIDGLRPVLAANDAAVDAAG